MPRPIDALRGWVPRWWRGDTGRAGRALHHALAPAEAGFSAISAARNAAYDRGWLRARRAPIAVVSVGNIGVGGAGKTPFSAWVAARLARTGRRPAIVMRGYGADEVAVHRELNPDVPVLAAARRIDGVVAAAEADCDAAVLDDAFQHRAVARDVDVVLVAAETWTARRHLLPRGPWRERGAALGRADLVVVTRKSAGRDVAAAVARECATIGGGVPVAICHLAPTRLVTAGGGELPLEWLAGRGVLVVASLADPVPFLRQVQELGADAELLPYPDHHAFTPADLREIARRAGGRTVICTRKEAVKVRPLLAGTAAVALDVVFLDQGVVIEEGDAAIERALAGLPR